MIFFFFFQAEDGIRDYKVTGVQTCALPIWFSSAAVAAQELYPHLGHGPIKREVLRAVQRLREDDVRTLHRFQLGVQGVLLRHGSRNPVVKWLRPTAVPRFFRPPRPPGAHRPAFSPAPLPPPSPR